MGLKIKNNSQVFLSEPPTFSVITPVYKPSLNELEECLRSAMGPGVEHILVLDGKTNVSSIAKLKRLVKKYNGRILVIEKQVGISEASNHGARNSSADFFVFLDQDDFLDPNWLPVLSLAKESHDFLYSDVFLVDERGNKLHMTPKPDWSPIRLIFNMYAVHLMAVRASIFWKAGGFRSEFDGSQDHDLALRVSRVTNSIKHISMPLYNWRQSSASTASDPENKPWAYEAGREAAQNHLNKIGSTAQVERLKQYPGGLKAVFKERDLPISVVIPTKFQKNPIGRALVELLLESLMPFLNAELGDEVILVHRSGESFQLSDAALGKPVVFSIQDSKKFNFSRRCNIGFLVSKNENILLLNDDLEFGVDNPLTQLNGLLKLPNVGLVGGLLAFPDFSIQHGGQAFQEGLPTHAHFRSPSLVRGLFDLLIDREAVGVTGALMFQKKSTWEAIGGFSTLFPLNFNDVDYCQKVRSLGLSVIQANSVLAIHRESSTRDSSVTEQEISLIMERWGDAMSHDGFAINNSGQKSYGREE
jgi:GT2 family glycosyltransferase